MQDSAEKHLQCIGFNILQKKDDKEGCCLDGGNQPFAFAFGAKTVKTRKEEHVEKAFTYMFALHYANWLRNMNLY